MDLNARCCCMQIQALMRTLWVRVVPTLGAVMLLIAVWSLLLSAVGFPGSQIVLMRILVDFTATRCASHPELSHLDCIRLHVCKSMSLILNLLRKL